MVEVVGGNDDNDDGDDAMCHLVLFLWTPPCLTLPHPLFISITGGGV